MGLPLLSVELLRRPPELPMKNADTDKKLDATTFPGRMKLLLEYVGGGRGALVKLQTMTEISARTLKNWADGDVEPNLSSLARLARGTGANVKWLVSGEGA